MDSRRETYQRVVLCLLFFLGGHDGWELAGKTNVVSFGSFLCLFCAAHPRFTFRESVQQHNFEKATTQQSASASTRHPS